MKRIIFIWLASVMVTGVFTFPLAVQGQTPPVNQPPQQPPPGQQPVTGQPPPKSPQTPGTPGQPGAPVQQGERRPPAFEYLLGMISVLLVLVIVCMPSRKG